MPCVANIIPTILNCHETKVQALLTYVFEQRMRICYVQFVQHKLAQLFEMVTEQYLCYGLFTGAYVLTQHFLELFLVDFYVPDVRCFICHEFELMFS